MPKQTLQVILEKLLVVPKQLVSCCVLSMKWLHCLECILWLFVMVRKNSGQGHMWVSKRVESLIEKRREESSFFQVIEMSEKV